MNILKTIIGKLTVAKLNLAMLTVLVTFVAYPLFAPITPAVYGKPMVQDAGNLYAGQPLTYKIHACRKVSDSVVTTITRQLVPVSNKQLQPINLNTDVVTNDAGCVTNIKTLIIPYSTPEGSYKLRIRGVYAVIPLRQPISVMAESDTLNIHATTVSQEIQELIDANNILRSQLEAQVPVTNGSKSVTTQNKNGSSTTSTNTNSTTTTGQNPAPTSNNDSQIKAIIKALGGNPILPRL